MHKLMLIITVNYTLKEKYHTIYKLMLIITVNYTLKEKYHTIHKLNNHSKLHIRNKIPYIN